MNKQQIKEQQKNEAIERLRTWGVVDGATIYTTLKHVSASGMSRRISCFIVLNGRIECIDYKVSQVLGLREGCYKKGGVTVKGCGMDMGFWLVDALGGAMGINLKNEWI